MNKSIKLIVNYLLGPLLFVILSYLLFKQIINQPDLEIRYQQIKLSWKEPVFWLVFLLMFLNWGIESVKWKLLLSPLEKISLFQSVKSVFAGCSITMLTPNRTGRILFVKPENRLTSISTTILGSISQLSITILLGAIAIIYLKNSGNDYLLKNLPWIFNDFIFYFSLISSIILILLFFKIHFLVVFLSRIPLLKKVIRHLEIVDSFTGKVLLRILFLSFARYMIFILQYILLLRVLHVEIDFYLCFWLLSVFYLAMAILPTIGFTELPVRATVSVMIIGLFSTNTLGIQAAAFGIWCINLVIPAVIGSFFILSTKILKSK